MGLFDQPFNTEKFNKLYKKLKEEGYPFHPFATVKDMSVGLGIVTVLLACTFGWGVHLDDPADPAGKPGYLPRPEWYFLFLFQLLKFFPGDLEIIGVAIIPGIAAVLMLLLPFYDRNPYRSPSKRPIAMLGGAFAIFSVLGLTFMALAEDAALNKNAPAASHGEGSSASHDGKPDGAALYSANCQMCHGANGDQMPAVKLFNKEYMKKRDDKLITDTIVNGNSKGMMAFKGKLKDEEIAAIVAHLRSAAK